MFCRGVQGCVRDATGTWELLIGWSKSKQKYWISINGKKFDDMDSVPGRNGTEEESKARKMPPKKQLTMATRTSSNDAGDFDIDMSS